MELKKRTKKETTKARVVGSSDSARLIESNIASRVASFYLKKFSLD